MKIQESTHVFSVGLQLLFTFVIACTIILSGCGGTKILKEPLVLEVTQPLATASNQNVSAELIWVIVRDGPGTWAKNADWDEYLVNVVNESKKAIQFQKLTKWFSTVRTLYTVCFRQVFH